jgi:hypothetical protein
MTTPTARLPLHAESRGLVAAAPDAVFAYLDDPLRLSAHMGRRSWRMGGGRMDVTLDEARGRAVGSRIVLAGHAFGLPLRLDEVVVERSPPASKAWATLGEPRLVVIGAYRMGFVIEPHGRTCALRVFIDYALPARALPRALGRRLGNAYARWCTRAMVADAVAHFASPPAPGRP